MYNRPSVRYNKDMFLTGVVQWWYTEGWRQRAGLVREQLARTLDYFSINLLLKTLFSPFRQISAGGASGPFQARLQAFFDKLISRFIGAFMRSIVVIIGLITIGLQLTWGAIVLGFWLMVPLLPIIGLVLFCVGWLPQ